MHRKKYKNKTVKGFTLIELVVSIVILAIVVLPILTAFVISARTNTKAKSKKYWKSMLFTAEDTVTEEFAPL